MPFITVWNNDPFNHESAYLRDGLRRACLGIKELGLTKDEDVTVYIVCNPHPSYDGGPVIIIVELLFDKPERTLEVRQRLAASLGEAMKAYYRKGSYGDREVEVAVKRFNPERDAFWKG